MVCGPSSHDLNPLDYQVWGNAGVLSQAATEAKTVPQFKNALQLIWSASPEKTIDNSGERLSHATVGIGHCEHIMR